MSNTQLIITPELEYKIDRYVNIVNAVLFVKTLNVYVLTFYNGRMFSQPHFQFKSVNISTILTYKLKMCVRLVTCFLAIAWNICFLSGIYM